MKEEQQLLTLSQVWNTENKRIYDIRNTKMDESSNKMHTKEEGEETKKSVK